MRFIEINNRMLDFGNYCGEAIMLRKIFILDMNEYFGKFGFVLVNKRLHSYCGAEIVLYNKALDLEITFEIKKKTKERFV